MSNGIQTEVNTNPMVFEELATSLATLATYARNDDMDMPVRDMEHLYTRALQGPPSYTEITSLTGHNLSGRDRQTGRAAWMMMNIEGLSVCAVHSKVWHKVAGKFSAPILNQLSLALDVESQLRDEEIQKLGTDDMIDLVGVKDSVIWLVEVVTSKDVADSVLSRTKSSELLFRTNVFKNPVLKKEQVASLFNAKKQMTLAFPSVEVATLVMVQHPDGPDFELYQVSMAKNQSTKDMILKSSGIVKNSIDYTDRICDDHEAMLKMPELLDNNLFRGVPPCRGGRTLGILGTATSRQINTDDLLMFKRGDFIRLVKEDFGFDIEKDKVRHDLDDRLVAQGFFRKWGPEYYVSMKGVARYQYCLAKFTTKGKEKFDLDLCVKQRDRIMSRFGCLN